METVQESETKRKKAETELMGKVGEVSVIRSKLNKVRPPVGARHARGNR